MGEKGEKDEKAGAAHARGAAGADATARATGSAAGRSHRALTYHDYAVFARMDDAAISRACEVKVFRATGPGGQGVNTTDSAVRMRHLPTGITVTARESRSQHQNRQLCLAKLRAEFERRARRPKPRKKTKVPRKANERRLEAKRRRADVKQSRRHVDW